MKQLHMQEIMTSASRLNYISERTGLGFLVVFFFFYQKTVKKKKKKVEIKSTMNNNTCTFCYPLMSSTKQPCIVTSPGCQAPTRHRRRRCGCAISGRLFLNVYNDLHFLCLNVLKATVTGVLNWVSITSIPGSVPPRRNKR